VFVTNHVLSGVLIGRVLEDHPVAAFAVGVGSHLVVDMIPHWGCDRAAEGGSERFLAVARRDGLLGLAAMGAASLAVDRRARPSVIAAMAGAVLLDLDKPIEHFFGVYPYPNLVRRVHLWCQNESAEGMPREVAFGLAFAVADTLAAVASRRRPRPVTTEPPTV
jgi:hypothetical protein